MTYLSRLVHKNQRSGAMRTVFLSTAALLAVCLINTAATAPVSGDEYADYAVSSDYGAPACAAPAYCGPLVPGCCEYAPSCLCDDIWAGYCQEKNQGCGWPVICIPVIKRPFFRSSYYEPRGAPPCDGTVEPPCAEPDCERSALPPAGKSAQPAPSAQPAAKTPPAKPQPGEEVEKGSSAGKSSRGWRFLPAASSVTR